MQSIRAVLNFSCSAISASFSIALNTGAFKLTSHSAERSQDLGNDTIPDQDETLQPKSLLPYAGNLRQPMPRGVHYNLIDYLKLVDWTGRQMRDYKRGSIKSSIPSVLQRIGIAPEHWIELCTNFANRFKGVVGSQHSLKNLLSWFLDLREEPIIAIPNYFTAGKLL